MRIANRFIALPVAAGDWYHQLRATAPPGVRPIDAADLHVTLLFLGCGRRALAQRTLARLQADPPPQPPDPRLGAPAVFGGSRASACGYDLDGVAGLIAWLNQHRTALLAAAGAAVDTRPPRPHLSIARPGDVPEADVLQWLAGGCGEAIRLAAPVLYQNAPPGVRPRYRLITGH
ncbi:MAG: hypothetical protein KGJ55_03005 [Gammaproteobacteria bacterium]|nr:hypothetical protein [Gammaproteobacteria bacterium]